MIGREVEGKVTEDSYGIMSAYDTVMKHHAKTNSSDNIVMDRIKYSCRIDEILIIVCLIKLR